MIKQLLNRSIQLSPDLLKSDLFNEDTFYATFLKDISECQSEVIIESPFVTNKRVKQLLPVLRKLKERHVRVAINTRDPKDHDSDFMRREAHEGLSQLQHLGIQVIYTSGHHRKLAIIDRRLLWEGSLNVLSQNKSCELMRRIESTSLAWQMIRFTDLDKFLNY